jgi:hypothetical protein
MSIEKSEKSTFIFCKIDTTSIPEQPAKAESISYYGLGAPIPVGASELSILNLKASIVDSKAKFSKCLVVILCIFLAV